MAEVEFTESAPVAEVDLTASAPTPEVDLTESAPMHPPPNLRPRRRSRSSPGCATTAQVEELAQSASTVWVDFYDSDTKTGVQMKKLLVTTL